MSIAGRVPVGLGKLREGFNVYSPRFASDVLGADREMDGAMQGYVRCRFGITVVPLLRSQGQGNERASL